MTDEGARRRESIHVAGVNVDRGAIPLYAGLLGAPLLWAIQFQLTYMLVPWACTHRNHWLLPLIHLVFFFLSIACGVLSWREWRRVGATPPQSQEEERVARTKFLGALGLMSVALFALLILAQTLTSFFLDPCWA
jgi:hypothetical protein